MRLHTLTLLCLLPPSVAAQTPMFTYAVTGKNGWSVAGAGDIDGDQVPDIVTCELHNAAWVHSGADGHLIWKLLPPATGYDFGWSCDAGLDLNKDGVPDVLVGQPSINSYAGAAHAYSGATGALLYTIPNTNAGHQLGSSVAIVGDADGDGAADFALGTANNSIGGPYEVTLYSGATGAPIRTWNVGSLYGKRGVSRIGDVDGDGHADVAISYPTQGDVYVYSGLDGSVLLAANLWQNGAALAIGAAGDVNQDGTPDLVVGVTSKWGGGLGHVTVLSGVAPAVLHTFPGTGSQYVFGYAVAGAGDVDNDGFADIAIGEDNVNRAYVYSGRTGGLMMTLVPGIGSPFQSGNLGGSLAGPGDLNGDGYDDVLVGLPSWSCGGCPGTATTFSGVPLPVARVGKGCAVGSFPSLDATAPVRGQTMLLNVSNALPNGVGALLLSATSISTRVSPACTLHLAPSFTLLTGFSTSAAGTWGAPLPIHHSLPAGLQANFQVLVGFTPMPFGVDLSNGVRVTVQ